MHEVTLPWQQRQPQCMLSYAEKGHPLSLREDLFSNQCFLCGIRRCFDPDVLDCRGLFERHKLLLSLQMCVRILQSASQINNEEWQFFLKGGMVLDRSQQAKNPAPAWLSELAWDNITELDSLASFKVGLCLASLRNALGLCWPCLCRQPASVPWLHS